jgi:hypothetical protein
MKIERSLVIKAALVLSAVTIPVALGGCGGARYVWYHSGNDAAGFAADRLQCEEESAKYAMYVGKRGDDDIITERMKECMGLRGYVRTLERDLPEGAPRYE